MEIFNLIATSAFGLEAVVKKELQGLGLVSTAVSDGRIGFSAGADGMARANLGLRTADRVLLKLGEFPAPDFGELFDRTRELSWERWIPEDAKITVIGKTFKSKLESVRSGQSIVKKAVLEKLKTRYHRETFEESGAEFTIQFALHKDIAQLTLDTTGEGLHKRGYRKSRGEVPLRENLAAALVLLSSWKRDHLLLDPMCGSGTILIEAAMLARDIAPGLKRSFAAECWPEWDAGIWNRAREEARARIRPAGGWNIRGSDRDPERIRDAKANAAEAGVGEDISFEVKDIRELSPGEPYGCMITNPPYGEKLGTPRDLEQIYASLRQIFSSRPDWSLFLLTADKRFPEQFRKSRPDRVRKLFNGTIEAQYYQYGLHKSRG